MVDVPASLVRILHQAQQIEDLDSSVCNELASEDPLDESRLRRVYSAIEAVLLACAENYNSAVGGFEVYAACFSAITAIVKVYGHEQWVIEETTRLLESVHEVYDVLLGCAETYEWASPGVTGRLRLDMLEVLTTTFGREGFTAPVLMELLNNDVSSAVALLAYVLRTAGAGFELQEMAAGVLEELTTADCLFCPDDPRYEGEQITKLTALLNKHCNALIQALIQFDVVEAFGRCICEHQESHVRTDILIRAFVGIIHNALLYCTENQKRLRMHIATHSTVVQDIMIPYVENIFPVLEAVPSLDEARNCVEFRNLAGALKAFIVCTFNINVLRASFSRSDMLVRLMMLPPVMQSVHMLEYLIKLHINIDFVSSPYFAQMRDMIEAAHSALSDDQKGRLTRRLQQTVHALPMSNAPRAMNALVFAFGEEHIEAMQTPSSSAKKRRGGNRNRRRRRRGKKRFGLANTRRGGGASAREPGPESLWQDADDAGSESSEDDDEANAEGDERTPLLEAENIPPYPAFPDKAKCELGGGMMRDPVQTPDGHLFDRPVLEDWVQQNGTDPISGAPLEMTSCVASNELQRAIADYQSKIIAIDLAADKQVAAAEQHAAAAMSGAPPAPAQSRLLGDLPSLAAESQVPELDKKEKKKIKINRAKISDCPEEFKCGIDGKIVTQPLRTPTGHVFETKTLEQWFQTCGSVCPVQNTPMRLEDCVLDKELQKRVVKWFKETSGA
jgi:hypothetical protein